MIGGSESRHGVRQNLQRIIDKPIDQLLKKRYESSRPRQFRRRKVIINHANDRSSKPHSDANTTTGTVATESA